MAAIGRQKPGSLVVGEIVNYPAEWLQSMDAVTNLTLRQIVLGVADGELSGSMGARLVDRLVQDAGIEPMLKSWIVFDNHDIPRVATLVPDLAMRKENRALRAGHYRLIEFEHLFAFEQRTDRALETIVVGANPSDREITEQQMIANPGLIAGTLMVDALNRSSKPVGKASSGFLKVVVPPVTTLVLKPQERDLGGYSRNKRVDRR